VPAVAFGPPPARRLLSAAVALVVGIVLVAVAVVPWARHCEAVGARHGDRVGQGDRHRVQLRALEVERQGRQHGRLHGREQGQLLHDFGFPGLHKHTTILDTGMTAKLTLVFKRKGHFAYIWSVPRHVQDGMSGLFLVK
jgi:hypothetical protein